MSRQVIPASRARSTASNRRRGKASCSALMASSSSRGFIMIQCNRSCVTSVEGCNLSYMSMNRGAKKHGRRIVEYPFSVSRDAQRTVTDRETGMVLGSVAESSTPGRWSAHTELGLELRFYDHETITDAAQALHRAWRLSHN